MIKSQKVLTSTWLSDLLVACSYRTNKDATNLVMLFYTQCVFLWHSLLLLVCSWPAMQTFSCPYVCRLLQLRNLRVLYMTQGTWKTYVHILIWSHRMLRELDYTFIIALDTFHCYILLFNSIDFVQSLWFNQYVTD